MRSRPPTPLRRTGSYRCLISVLVVSCLCVLAFAVRYRYRPPLGDGADGAYYFQIARQVARGAGLETTYSVFHMGLSPLPQRATSYPLLPLAIGYLSRIVPLQQAAVWLPGGLYVLSIGLCFGFLSWAIARSLPRCGWWTRLCLATLLTSWVGLNSVYVWTSARPYTETLGVVLVLASLWCFGLCSVAQFQSPRTRAFCFFGVGVLAGLCYLARFQLISVAIAVLLGRLLARDRRAWLDSVSLAVGIAPCIGWQAWRLFSLPNAEAYALLDFAMYRQLPSLPRFVYDLQFDSRAAWFVDKLRGALTSLDPDSEESYVSQLSYLAWLVPLGLCAFTIRLVLRFTKRGRRASAFASLRDPQHAAWLASALAGLFAVAPIHTVHSQRWHPWAFGWRQGMPLVFLILPCAIWLWSTNRWLAQASVAFALAVSVVIGAQKTLTLISFRVSTQLVQGYADVASFLDSVGPTQGTLGMEHQALGVFTEAPLYWLACWSPPELATTLVERLPIERIVLRPGESRCSSLNGIRSRLRVERHLDAHYPMTVYRIAR